MARFEPENNLDMVLEGVALRKDDTPILVIGNHSTKYGSYLKEKFRMCANIKFIGPVYKLQDLNNLRYFSNLYFHGHSVGGTNPSLLEAMASQALVAAHDNDFNKGILKENGIYFSTSSDVEKLLGEVKKSDNLRLISNNFKNIVDDYNWDKINGEYLRLFEECLSKSKAAN